MVTVDVKNGKGVITEGKDSLVGKLLAAKGQLKINNPRARQTIDIVDEHPKEKPKTAKAKSAKAKKK